MTRSSGGSAMSPMISYSMVMSFAVVVGTRGCLCLVAGGSNDFGPDGGRAVSGSADAAPLPCGRAARPVGEIGVSEENAVAGRLGGGAGGADPRGRTGA